MTKINHWPVYLSTRGLRVVENVMCSEFEGQPGLEVQEVVSKELQVRAVIDESDLNRWPDEHT